MDLMCSMLLSISKNLSAGQIHPQCGSRIHNKRSTSKDKGFWPRMINSHARPHSHLHTSMLIELIEVSGVFHLGRIQNSGPKIPRPQCGSTCVQCSMWLSVSRIFFQPQKFISSADQDSGQETLA